jgi:DNA-binding MarR family transcriptional regulator
MSNLTTHELDSPPWLRVESTLMATARLVRVAFDTRLAPLDLNLTQASVLGYIEQFGATTQTDLADHLGIGRAAIGSVIDRLQARGLVERQPKQDDRRVWLIAITTSGSELAARVKDVDEVLRAELRHGLGREERQALAWVMTRLQQNLASAIAKTPEPGTSIAPTPSTPRAMSETPVSGGFAHRSDHVDPSDERNAGIRSVRSSPERISTTTTGEPQ